MLWNKIDYRQVRKETSIPKRKQKKTKYYAINDRIRADEMRVVDGQAGQLGVLSKEEALRIAKEKGLDLVLVAPNAKPPVVKMIDFAKFKYQEKQKHASGMKKTKQVDIKEIRFTPFIADGDYQIRIKRAKEFLQAGNKVKLNVKFVGRQITRKEFGRDLMDRAIEELSELSTIEREPSFQGKVLVAQLQPKK